MQGIGSRIRAALAGLIMVSLLVQFYLAGVGTFGASSFEAHRIVGNAVGLPILLLLILELAGRTGRRQIGLSALLLLLYVVQATLPAFRESLPYVSALHAINALALMGVTAAVMRAERAVGASRPTERVTTVGAASAPDVGR